jgi:hypothetical protein
MVKFYLSMIQRGKIALDDVPPKWRAEVAEKLKETEEKE